jgi:hypothetical protein
MKKANNIISIIKILITGIFIIVKDKFIISVNKMIYDNAQKAYEISYNTSQQTMIKESNLDNDKLSTLSEMWLCFAELIILAILSIIAIYIKEKIFIFIFVLEILAVFYNKKIVKDYYKTYNTKGETNE